MQHGVQRRVLANEYSAAGQTCLGSAPERTGNGVVGADPFELQPEAREKFALYRIIAVATEDDRRGITRLIMRNHVPYLAVFPDSTD